LKRRAGSIGGARTPRGSGVPLAGALRAGALLVGALAVLAGSAVAQEGPQAPAAASSAANGAAPAETPGAPAGAAAGGRVTATDLVSLARGEDGLVAKVGDVILRRSDAFRILDLATPARSVEVIRQMVLTTGAQLDALKEGIDVPAEELEASIASAIAEQKASFALEVDEHLALEDYLRKRHGMSAAEYHAEVRRMVLAAMLLERAVRLDQLRTDREDLELIVVEDEALARDIERQLAEGASFSVLAKKHSVHPSAAGGGTLPPVPAGADVPLLAGRSALEAGQRLGPEPITVGERTLWRLLRLVERTVADARPWSELRETIERGLSERPLSADELTLFEARIVDRYGVTRFEGPP
jgi:hypothetical protein